MLTLYQAEWCPFSAAVREVLTELGLDVRLCQVEPAPGKRTALRALAGTDEIPVLVDEGGAVHTGTRAIFAHLRERDPWAFAAAHRRRYAEHRDARESDATGRLLEHFRGTGELERAAGAAADAVVTDVPGESRYELRLGGRLAGVAAYRRSPGRIAITHTEVAEDLQGRGLGARLAHAALEDARRDGVEVLPLCPFIAAYVRRHPEYAELVPAGFGGR